MFNVETEAFIGVHSRLKFTDCFLLPSVAKKDAPQINYTPNPDNDEEKVDDEIPYRDHSLYSWSIYGNLHKQDMNTFEWTVVSEHNDNEPQSR